MNTSTAAELEPDWEQWRGEIVDGQYALEKLLGAHKSAAVFLTTIDSRPAAIKIVLARNEELAKLTARWSRAAGLKHPNLLKIFAFGTWSKANTSLGYVVTEYAEENLAAVLAERALSPEEILEMLRPVSAVLVFLHDMGLALGSLRPSNIFAVEDVLKVSSDAIAPADAALDLYSLAGTVVEALTRKPFDSGVGPPRRAADLLPQPFQEIARRCLGSDGRSQWSARELAAWLGAQQIGHAVSPHPRHPTRRLSVMLLFVAAILTLVITVGAVLRSRGTVVPARAPELGAKSQQSAAPVPAPSQPRETSEAKPARLPSRASTPRAHAIIADGSVTRQVLPEIPPKALRTIRGKATVVVRLAVGPSGEVTDVSAERGGSRYFGKLAVEAARKWRFTPSNAGSREVLVKFEITRAGARAFLEKAGTPR